MEISLIGMISLPAALFALVAPRRLAIWPLLLLAPFSATAAVTVAGNSVPPFYVVGIAIAVRVVAWFLVDRLALSRVEQRGLGFVAVALLVSALSPALFAGTPVLSPRGGIDSQLLEPTPLAYSVSMVAQLGYLAIGFAVALFIARSRCDLIAPISAMFMLGLALSVLRLFDGVAPLIDSVFRNFDSAHYNPWESRHFGVFPEPSYLGVFAVAALVFAVTVLVLRGLRASVLAIIALAMVNVAASSSGTVAGSVAVMLVVLLVIFSALFLSGRIRVAPMVAAVVIVGAASVLVFTPLLATIRDTLAYRADSGSLANRLASDIFTLGLLRDTFGLGVGLGANRPSSFVTFVLGSVGVVGAAALLWFIASAVREAWRSADGRIVATTLMALCVAKAIAEPALSTPLLWVLIGACLAAAAEGNPDHVRARRRLRPHARSSYRVRGGRMGAWGYA